MNTGLILQMAADGFSDRVIVSIDDREMTFGELQQRAHNAASWLLENNYQRVAYLDTVSEAFPVMIFAAGVAGIPFVPLNYRLAKDELNALLRRVENAVLISNDSYTKPLEVPNGMATISANEFLSLPAGNAELPEVSPDAVAVELFTSGTTGTPKAALLRHENLMSYILTAVEYASAAEDDANVITVPPYHIAGISAVLSSSYACRRMIQLPDFTPEAWLDLARKNAISNAFLVPTMLSRIIDYLDEKNIEPELPALKSLAYGGGKMPMATIERAMQIFPEVSFTNAYGLTETSSTITLLGPEEHRQAAQSEDPAVQKRLTSVGVPLPTIELQIRGESGEVLPAGEVGGVYVRGDQVAGEYRGKGQLLDADGWFETKDMGYLDEGGYLFLGGRLDDVIVRGGENISPGEIERVMQRHSSVTDVAVVAIESEEWGETVAAVVVADADEQLTVELKDLVKSNLRSSRVPEKVLYKTELPYNETGKLLRRVLRQELSDAIAAGIL